MKGLGKDYIRSELFQHFNAAFLRKVEEIAHAITNLYCTQSNGLIFCAGMRVPISLTHPIYIDVIIVARFFRE